MRDLFTCGVVEHLRSQDLCLQKSYPPSGKPAIYHRLVSIAPKVMDLLGPTDTLPKTKQKSCDSCVSGKRRCDRRKPVCSRCAHKKISCIYGKTISTSQLDRDESDSSTPFMHGLASESSACSLVVPGRPPNDELEDLSIDPRLGSATTESMPDFMMDACFDEDVPMDPFANLMGNIFPPSQDAWLFQGELGPMQQRPSSPVDEEVMQSYRNMAASCVRFDLILSHHQELDPDPMPLRLSCTRTTADYFILGSRRAVASL